MKKILMIISLLTASQVFAQHASVYKELASARSSIKTAPRSAFDIYLRLAKSGNVEAMNAVGNCYNTGIGTTVDEHEAFSWFNKSADAGYAKAWYNLGLMYKLGISVPLDYNRAYECFKKGATLNNDLCIYAQGYMSYKGLGCIQNYELAVQLFKRGVKMLDEGSYYMLGLCYRNGYGIKLNLDSARYCLQTASELGDHRAIQELNDNEPENIDLRAVPNLQPQGNGPNQPVNLKAGFNQITHRVVQDDIAGEYIGYAIKFDWSGKHIISQAGLKVNFERKNKKLTGEWQEENQESVSIAGSLEDTALVFNNTSYGQIDHYHKANPLAVNFKDARLNLVKNRDTVFLTGTLRLYSPKTQEPQKPEFIMLIRTGGVNQNSYFAMNADTSKTDSLHFVAYPNPFSYSLNLRYTLKKSARVSIMVSNLLNGTIVYHSQVAVQANGDHISPIVFNGQPGNYVVTLQYDNNVKSAIVFKQ